MREPTHLNIQHRSGSSACDRFLQRIDTESDLPALGSALLALARGDSTGTLATLRRVADRLTPEYGRPDVLLLARRCTT